MHTVLQLQLRSLMCLLTAWACEHDDCMNVMWWLHECDDCIKAVKAYTSSHWSPYWYALCIKLAIQYIKTEISPDQHYKHLVARWVICLFHIDHHFRLFKALAARTFQPHFNLSLHRLPHTILLIESFNPIIFTYLSPSLTRSRVVAKSWNFVRQHQQNRTWPNYPVAHCQVPEALELVPTATVGKLLQPLGKLPRAHTTSLNTAVAHSNCKAIAVLVSQRWSPESIDPSTALGVIPRVSPGESSRVLGPCLERVDMVVIIWLREYT